MFSGQLVKTDGKLVYTDNKEKLLYELFIDKLIDGEEVEIFISVKGQKASAAQISKIHTCIRVIAMDLGYSFEDLKVLVKEKAGLCYTVEDEQSTKVVCKSFADCNITEMSLAIEACNQIAEEQGIKLG
jgi:hypothetical protein